MEIQRQLLKLIIMQPLLDALGVNNKVIVMGTSAGALSSIEFSLRYPDRTAGLILLVPGLYNPSSEDRRRTAEEAAANPMVDIITENDFAFWLFSKLLGSSLVEHSWHAIIAI